MNKKTAFIVDSTTIVPEEFKKSFRYEVVSLHVMIEGKEKAEVDTKDEEIESRLENTKSLKSSSPSTGEFQKAFDVLIKEGYEDIIVLVLSKNSSTTYNVANMVIDTLPEEKKSHIYNIDTKINNFGLTNVLLSLSYWGDKEISGKDLAEKATQYTKDSHLSFTLLDLVHLFRGGRLSKLSCALGLLFRIKPVIEMIDGTLELTKKERVTPKIIAYFLGLIDNFAKNYKKVYCRFVYLGDNKANVDQMVETVKAKYDNLDITIVDRVGPVFLVHLGNNGFGVTLTGVNDQE